MYTKTNTLTQQGGGHTKHENSQTETELIMLFPNFLSYTNHYNAGCSY